MVMHRVSLIAFILFSEGVSSTPLDVLKYQFDAGGTKVQLKCVEKVPFTSLQLVGGWDQNDAHDFVGFTNIKAGCAHHPDWTLDFPDVANFVPLWQPQTTAMTPCNNGGYICGLRGHSDIETAYASFTEYEHWKEGLTRLQIKCCSGSGGGEIQIIEYGRVFRPSRGVYRSPFDFDIYSPAVAHDEAGPEWSTWTNCEKGEGVTSLSWHHESYKGVGKKQEDFGIGSLSMKCSPVECHQHKPCGDMAKAFCEYMRCRECFNDQECPRNDHRCHRNVCVLPCYHLDENTVQGGELQPVWGAKGVCFRDSNLVDACPKNPDWTPTGDGWTWWCAPAYVPNSEVTQDRSATAQCRERDGQAIWEPSAPRCVCKYECVFDNKRTCLGLGGTEDAISSLAVEEVSSGADVSWKMSCAQTAVDGVESLEVSVWATTCHPSVPVDDPTTSTGCDDVETYKTRSSGYLFLRHPPSTRAVSLKADFGTVDSLTDPGLASYYGLKFVPGLVTEYCADVNVASRVRTDAVSPYTTPTDESWRKCTFVVSNFRGKVHVVVNTDPAAGPETSVDKATVHVYFLTKGAIADPANPGREPDLIVEAPDGEATVSITVPRTAGNRRLTEDFLAIPVREGHTYVQPLTRFGYHYFTVTHGDKTRVKFFDTSFVTLSGQVVYCSQVPENLPYPLSQSEACSMCGVPDADIYVGGKLLRTTGSDGTFEVPIKRSMPVDIEVKKSHEDPETEKVREHTFRLYVPGYDTTLGPRITLDPTAEPLQGAVFFDTAVQRVATSFRGGDDQCIMGILNGTCGIVAQTVNGCKFHMGWDMTMPGEVPPSILRFLPAAVFSFDVDFTNCQLVSPITKVMVEDYFGASSPLQRGVSRDMRAADAHVHFRYRPRPRHTMWVASWPDQSILHLCPNGPVGAPVSHTIENPFESAQSEPNPVWTPRKYLIETKKVVGEGDAQAQVYDDVVPMAAQGKYSARYSVYEQYHDLGDDIVGTCRLNGHVHVVDDVTNLADEPPKRHKIGTGTLSENHPQNPLPSTAVQLPIVPSVPQGVFPFIRKFNVHFVRDDENGVTDAEFVSPADPVEWNVVVTGDVLLPGDFLPNNIDTPDLILRDPPGGESSATFEAGSTLTSEASAALDSSMGLGSEQTVSQGFKIENIMGNPNSKMTLGMKTSSNVATTATSDTSWKSSVTLSSSFSTSTLPYLTGKRGDVMVFKGHSVGIKRSKYIEVEPRVKQADLGPASTPYTVSEDPDYEGQLLCRILAFGFYTYNVDPEPRHWALTDADVTGSLKIFNALAANHLQAMHSAATDEERNLEFGKHMTAQNSAVSISKALIKKDEWMTDTSKLGTLSAVLSGALSHTLAKQKTIAASSGEFNNKVYNGAIAMTYINQVASVAQSAIGLNFVSYTAASASLGMSMDVEVQAAYNADKVSMEGGNVKEAISKITDPVKIFENGRWAAPLDEGKQVIGGGVHKSWATTRTLTEGYSTGYTMATEGSTGLPGGFVKQENAVLDYEGGYAITHQLSTANSMSSEKEEETTITVDFFDPDVGDRFTFETKYDKNYGTPVFVVSEIKSVCPCEDPGESASPICRAIPTLAINAGSSLVRRNVDTWDAALFTVDVTESGGRPNEYILRIEILDGLGDNAKKIEDSGITVWLQNPKNPVEYGGDVAIGGISSGGRFFANFGFERYHAASVYRAYARITALLVCDYEMEVQYTEVDRPIVSDTLATLEMTWQPECLYDVDGSPAFSFAEEFMLVNSKMNDIEIVVDVPNLKPYGLYGVSLLYRESRDVNTPLRPLVIHAARQCAYCPKYAAEEKGCAEKIHRSAEALAICLWEAYNDNGWTSLTIVADVKPLGTASYDVMLQFRCCERDIDTMAVNCKSPGATSAALDRANDPSRRLLTLGVDRVPMKVVSFSPPFGSDFTPTTPIFVEFTKDVWCSDIVNARVGVRLEASPRDADPLDSGLLAGFEVVCEGRYVRIMLNAYTNYTKLQGHVLRATVLPGVRDWAGNRNEDVNQWDFGLAELPVRSSRVQARVPLDPAFAEGATDDEMRDQVKAFCEELAASSQEGESRFDVRLTYIDSNGDEQEASGNMCPGAQAEDPTVCECLSEDRIVARVLAGLEQVPAESTPATTASTRQVSVRSRYASILEERKTVPLSMRASSTRPLTAEALTAALQSDPVRARQDRVRRVLSAVVNDDVPDVVTLHEQVGADGKRRVVREIGSAAMLTELDDPTAPGNVAEYGFGVNLGGPGVFSRMAAPRSLRNASAALFEERASSALPRAFFKYCHRRGLNLTLDAYNDFMAETGMLLHDVKATRPLRYGSAVLPNSPAVVHERERAARAERLAALEEADELYRMTVDLQRLAAKHADDPAMFRAHATKLIGEDVFTAPDSVDSAGRRAYVAAFGSAEGFDRAPSKYLPAPAHLGRRGEGQLVAQFLLRVMGRVAQRGYIPPAYEMPSFLLGGPGPSRALRGGRLSGSAMIAMCGQDATLEGCAKVARREVVRSAARVARIAAAQGVITSAQTAELGYYGNGTYSHAAPAVFAHKYARAARRAKVLAGERMEWSMKVVVREPPADSSSDVVEPKGSMDLLLEMTTGMADGTLGGGFVGGEVSFTVQTAPPAEIRCELPLAITPPENPSWRYPSFNAKLGECVGCGAEEYEVGTAVSFNCGLTKGIHRIEGASTLHCTAASSFDYSIPFCACAYQCATDAGEPFCLGDKPGHWMYPSLRSEAARTLWPTGPTSLLDRMRVSYRAVTPDTEPVVRVSWASRCSDTRYVDLLSLTLQLFHEHGGVSTLVAELPPQSGPMDYLDYGLPRRMARGFSPGDEVRYCLKVKHAGIVGAGEPLCATYTMGFSAVVRGSVAGSVFENGERVDVTTAGGSVLGSGTIVNNGYFVPLWFEWDELLSLQTVFPEVFSALVGGGGGVVGVVEEEGGDAEASGVSDDDRRGGRSYGSDVARALRRRVSGDSSRSAAAAVQRRRRGGEVAADGGEEHLVVRVQSSTAAVNTVQDGGAECKAHLRPGEEFVCGFTTGSVGGGAAGGGGMPLVTQSSGHGIEVRVVMWIGVAILIVLVMVLCLLLCIGVALVGGRVSRSAWTAAAPKEFTLCSPTLSNVTSCVRQEQAAVVSTSRMGVPLGVMPLVGGTPSIAP